MPSSHVNAVPLHPSFWSNLSVKGKSALGGRGCLSLEAESIGQFFLLVALQVEWYLCKWWFVTGRSHLPIRDWSLQGGGKSTAKRSGCLLPPSWGWSQGQVFHPVSPMVCERLMLSQVWSLQPWEVLTPWCWGVWVTEYWSSLSASFSIWWIIQAVSKLNHSYPTMMFFILLFRL